MAGGKSLYVIAGPNGAGKTTFAREFLPHFANCQEFVNADLIASGLSPFSPRSAAIEAGRIMLGRIHELTAKGQTFAFETTLSGRSYLPLFRKNRAKGYGIHLFYLWVPGVELAIQRVRDRVREGGHSVPEEDIRRRFHRSLRNLFKEYLPLVDTCTLLDNSQNRPEVIAYAKPSGVEIVDEELFNKIKKDAGSI